jgi:hypothetical protein
MVALSTRRARFAGGSAIVKKVWSGRRPVRQWCLLRLGADKDGLAQISRA